MLPVTMGPLQLERALREALAMGADKVILLTDRAFGDPVTTSHNCKSNREQIQMLFVQRKIKP